MADLALVTTLPAQLQEWAAVARHALSESTQRAYAADSRAFADWCREEGFTSWPASASTVAAYLRAEAGKPATLRRRAATIARLHRAAGLPNPCADELVRLTLRGICRERGTDQKQAAGLTERDAISIRAHLGDSPRDLRDLALVLTARDLLARSAEVVTIKVEDLELTPEGALVRLRRRKTATESVTYFMGQEAATAVAAWLAAVGVNSGPVFRALTSNGRAKDSAISTRDVRRILKERARQARLPHAEAVSGHSARVGMSQDLVAADLDVAAVMQAGGWQTPRMVAQYTAKLTASRGAVARFYSSR